jgi:hypothetical protein
MLAVLVAGPQLWGLVAAGDLEGSTALVRWAAVAAGCALGAAAVHRIVTDYEAQAARAAAVAARHDTAPDGSRIVHEGTALPPDDGSARPGAPSRAGHTGE